MARGVRRRYCGPTDAIVTVLDGAQVEVRRGQVVDVTAEQGARLDAMAGIWDRATDAADIKPRDNEPGQVGEQVTATPPVLQ